MKTDWVPLTRKKTGHKEHFRKSRVETFVNVLMAERTYGCASQAARRGSLQFVSLTKRSSLSLSE